MKLEINRVWKDLESYVQKIKDFIEINHKGKDIHILIPCRWWEVIGSIVKNSLGLWEDKVTRVKFSNTRYEWGKEVIIKDISEETLFIQLCYNVKDREDTIVLFVDDLIDKGDTIEYIKKCIPRNKLIIAPLYRKTHSPKDIDIFEEEFEDIWLEFPWELFYSKK